MSDVKRQGGQPVYVLGAGFSAAIHSAMPVTNGIGHEIVRLLGDQMAVKDLKRSKDFEEWLSVRVTPMPFLEAHENAQRFADAQRAIAAIASIIEKGTTAATTQSVPLWLEQLLAIWSNEEALVITFNYDMLVERAINEIRPLALDGKDAVVVRPSDVVRPAPALSEIVYYEDYQGPARAGFQLLKVHGSVNWYWNASDAGGSSLTRTRETGRFDGVAGDDQESAGVGLLDRFLIPPVATKSDYYSPSLTKILWRTAGIAMRNTGRLTLVGYSIPPTDRATNELLTMAPDDAEVHVVSRKVTGQELAARAARFGDGNVRPHEGDSPLPAYAETRLSEQIERLRTTMRDGLSTSDDHDVIVAFPSERRDSPDGTVYALKLDHGSIRTVKVRGASDFRGTPIDDAIHGDTPGKLQRRDFVTLNRLRDLVEKQPNGRVTVEHDGRTYVIFGGETVPWKPHTAWLAHVAPTS